MFLLDASAPAPPDPPPVVAAALVDAAARSGVPLELLRAVAWVESRYNANARSGQGALGLMQLMPSTFDALRNRDGASLTAEPFDPFVSAALAAQWLRALHAKYRQWELALAAYVWGPGNVDRASSPASYPAHVVRYVVAVWTAAGWPVPRPAPRIVGHDEARELGLAAGRAVARVGRLLR